MHPIQHTEAFVLKSIESGESNKRLWLFTKDFGLIVANVQGVRKSGAKLKSHITDYTLINVDLVKGREVWRLVSAEVRENPFVYSYNELRARSFVRALGLVGRLCTEEGPEPELFEHLIETMQTISTPIDVANVGLFDAIVLWKILIILGYLELITEFEVLFKTPLVEATSLPKGVLKDLIKDVTDAINRTHL
jgi:DNA repair protein RecO (recombination protein O)